MILPFFDKASPPENPFLLLVGANILPTEIDTSSIGPSSTQPIQSPPQTKTNEPGLHSSPQTKNITTNQTSPSSPPSFVPPSQSPPLRCSTWPHKPIVTFVDYHCNFLTQSSPNCLHPFHFVKTLFLNFSFPFPLSYVLFF